MKKIIFALIMTLALLIGVSGCSEADKVNSNISKQADYFGCERRITVYNARTDKVILTMEGYMSLSNDDNSELVVTCKIGPDKYKKDYVYLSNSTLYVCEDISGTDTDPYHYKVYFHTNVLPSVETKL
ncbi:beta-sandwich lipoprotein [Caproiciproducens faecalis]|uniref:Lipoprotein n=1 Tax=Caproiciproducens faecalis TaxID=2820301 RepID=A0ABS7DRX8_9FIRM|nr:hypothetical protein [Caproiciproducens faecalis]MBW7573899.1 hypothetical protein [Caproiciproducens faecalis]